ncbi:MAG TPA: hypothetical protein VLQ93_02560 [Myxococcaceae bacterium]|nr:hypothetical protein [Myxococcaceae bacterium]
MKVLGRWMPPLGLAACLVLGGCTKKEEPPPAPQPTAPTTPEPPPPTTGTAAPQPDTGATAPQPDTGAGEPEAGTAAPAPTPGDTQALPPEDPKNREWTAGLVEVRRPSLQPVTLREVRTARNEGFDRVVFEFEGDQVPGYHLEYIDAPAIKCGSGEPTTIAGQGWLEVRMQPAQAHANGQVTVADRERKPGLPVLKELELTCDFEADVTWVLGVQEPNRYRVMELKEPARLVVDVRH